MTTNNNEIEYTVSVHLAPVQQVEVSRDRIYEGSRSLQVNKPVIGSVLVPEIQKRLEGIADDKDGPNYTVVLRRTGDYHPDMTDLGTVFFAETMPVSEKINAEDLIQIIGEILGVQ